MLQGAINLIAKVAFLFSFDFGILEGSKSGG